VYPLSSPHTHTHAQSGNIWVSFKLSGIFYCCQHKFKISHNCWWIYFVVHLISSPFIFSLCWVFAFLSDCTALFTNAVLHNSAHSYKHPVWQILQTMEPLSVQTFHFLLLLLSYPWVIPSHGWRKHRHISRLLQDPIQGLQTVLECTCIEFHAELPLMCLQRSIYRAMHLNSSLNLNKEHGFFCFTHRALRIIAV
jgi:hypothetical protein